MKILNLYSGIGGNRKMWQDVDVTAIENNPQIAKIYQDFFPDDEVIVGDAHKFLLDHFKEFDFIWSSPPCPTHSDIRRCGVHKGQYEAKYPDMKLYEEIVLLKYFAPKETKWVVENVKPYYKMLIPAIEVERHLFWSNFLIRDKIGNNNRKHNDIVGTSEVYGFCINGKECDNKRAVLRNLVNPQLGLHILNESKRDIQPEMFKKNRD
ncbi:MAG: DNA cytosine methyltransferase [Deltaproteobacteria bacterium]|nr:DNA cytosine methyltransferase [Deltaproteobacteria bacterium]